MGERDKMVKELTNFITTHKLSYDDFNSIASEARHAAKIFRKKRKNKQPQLPTEEQIKKFREILRASDSKYNMMFKVMLYLGLRVSELCRIEIKDIDMSKGKERIFVWGKGNSERYEIIPEFFIDELSLYMESIPKNNYLFESRYHTKYSSRGVQDIFKRHRDRAGITAKFTPHTLRHIILTFLAGEGFSEHELKTFSRHLSTSSLDVYTRTNTETIRSKINSALEKLSKRI